MPRDKSMVKLTENLDEIANKYNKTKDSVKYKDQWYKLVKEFANGPHNTVNDGL